MLKQRAQRQCKGPSQGCTAALLSTVNCPALPLLARSLTILLNVFAIWDVVGVEQKLHIRHSGQAPPATRQPHNRLCAPLPQGKYQRPTSQVPACPPGQPGQHRHRPGLLLPPRAHLVVPHLVEQGLHIGGCPPAGAHKDVSLHPGGAGEGEVAANVAQTHKVAGGARGQDHGPVDVAGLGGWWCGWGLPAAAWWDLSELRAAPRLPCYPATCCCSQSFVPPSLTCTGISRHSLPGLS